MGVGVAVGHAPSETMTSESSSSVQCLATSNSHSLLYVVPSDAHTGLNT